MFLQKINLVTCSQDNYAEGYYPLLGLSATILPKPVGSGKYGTLFPYTKRSRPHVLRFDPVGQDVGPRPTEIYIIYIMTKVNTYKIAYERRATAVKTSHH